MATEQLGTKQYEIAGQPTVAGFEVISAVYGFEEDAEDKQDSGGQHGAKIAYSRRATIQLELEALAAGTPATYIAGGALTASFVAGTPVAWKIRSATYGTTRGVQTLSLDLIALVDLLA